MKSVRLCRFANVPPSAADAASHLFFAYLRSLSPQQARAGYSMLPMSLQKLLQETEYPPQTPTLLMSSTYKVVMIVDTVSPTPFALLRRANHFQYRDDDQALRDFSEYEDPVTALTEECRRVLKAISLANQSQVSSSKHSTSLRDASWSRFEDIGFGDTLEEEEDEDTVKITQLRNPRGLRTTPASGGGLGRPTTPSWADFLSSGFIDDAPNGPSNLLLPPDKILPPIETAVRQRSSQSHRPRLESDRHLEPGELASISRFDLDEAFWWVWMSSLAPEETAERKSAFGRCAIIETLIRQGRWLIMEEMVKGAAPEPDAGAYIAEKKGFFSWTRRGRGVSRSKSVAKPNSNKNDRLNTGAAATIGSGISKTSIGPDQQAKIQAAAQKLQAKQLQEQQMGHKVERRGRTDAEVLREKTNSILTLQPAVVNAASPAMKWANKYDKDAIREAYLGNAFAGRGVSQTSLPAPDLFGSSGLTANGSSLKREASLRAPSPAPEPEQKSPPAQSPASASSPAPVPEKTLKAPQQIHPAERLEPTGRDSPLPPPPREEDSFEVVRENMLSPEPTSPDNKKSKKLHKDEKKTGSSGFRKLFGRNKHRHSKLPENAAVDVNNMLQAESPQSAARGPSPATVREEPQHASPGSDAGLGAPTERSEDRTPTQTPVTPAPSRPAYDPSVDDNLSRVDTAEATEAHQEFSRFDQGPLLEQPAYIPDEDQSVDSAAPPPIARQRSRQPPVDPEDDEGAPSPSVPMQDRWAAIRKNAAERASRQSEEQSRGAYSKTTDGDDDTSGEESKQYNANYA